MFPQASVILFMEVVATPRADTPSQTPPGQTPPRADTPLGRHPLDKRLRADTPLHTLDVITPHLGYAR